MILKELTIDEYNIFFRRNNVSIFQSINYANTMEKIGFKSLYYGLMDGSTIYGAGLILVKKKYGFKVGFIPRGFIIDYNNLELIKVFTSLLKKELSKKGIVVIKMHPPIIRNIYNKQTISNNKYDNIFNNLKSAGFNHLGYNNYFESLKPRFEAIIPLDKDINKLFNNISKNFKTKIRSADINGITIFKGDKNNLEYLDNLTKNKNLKYIEDLYDCFNNNIEFYYAKLDTNIYIQSIQYKYQKQINICSKANEQVFKNVLKNNNKIINRKLREENRLNEIKEELVYATKLIKDYPDGIIVAACLTIKNKDEIYLIMDGYDKEYKKMSAKHLLIWKLMEKYSKEGFKTFNLGGITNNIPNNKYQGLNDFKLNFGSLVYEYSGDFELIINKPLYLMYRNNSRISKIFKK